MGDDIDTGRTEARRSGEAFGVAINGARAPMVLTGPSHADHPVIHVNAAFSTLTGYAPRELIGRNLRMLQGRETDPGAAARLRQGIAAQHDVSVDIYNYRKDGSGFWNALSVSPVFDDEGRVLHHFAIAVDATARHAREMVEALDKLGAMASGVAHEFNNLLTVVLGNSEAVAREIRDSRQRERLGRVDSAARRAALLTAQMLSFGRRQLLDPRPTDLAALVAHVGVTLRRDCGARLDLRIEPAAGPVQALVDAAQLERAVRNLAGNAMAAMPGGGILLLAAHDCAASPEMSPGHWVEIVIADTGTGMTPDVLRRARDPFFTTRPGAATGLGLSMVHGFMEQSGGRLLIESEAGCGTRARLVLGRWDGAAGAA